MLLTFLNEHCLKKVIFFLYLIISELCKYCMSYYICRKTKKINLMQKRAVRFVFNEDRLSYSRPLSRKIIALNVYQINL